MYKSNEFELMQKMTIEDAEQLQKLDYIVRINDGRIISITKESRC